MGVPETNVEREVKLDAGLRFELPELTAVLPGVVATRLPNAKLQAIYVDTPDLRLMRWGVTVRHRRDAVGGAGGESGWTVKLPGDADGVALVRTELSWPGQFGPVPAEVASLVRAQARAGRLVPVAKLLTERHRVELTDRGGRTLGEVDDDVVSVMDGRRLAARFRQVEFEVSDAAPPELMEEVLRALTVAGAVVGDDRPKVVRAIGPRASLGPDVVIPPLDHSSTVATVVSAAIATGVTRIIRHDPGVRLGDDPEHVHQARVGTRRLRSDLRTFWRLLDPDWAGPVRCGLGWLAAALGEVRDADVLTGRLRAQTRSLSSVDAKAAAALLRRLAAQREEARLRLLAALDSERYVALLENLSQAAANPPLARSSHAAAGVDGPGPGIAPRQSVAATRGRATGAAVSAARSRHTARVSAGAGNGNGNGSAAAAAAGEAAAAGAAAAGEVAAEAATTAAASPSAPSPTAVSPPAGAPTTASAAATVPAPAANAVPPPAAAPAGAAVAPAPSTPAPSTPAPSTPEALSTAGYPETPTSAPDAPPQWPPAATSDTGSERAAVVLPGMVRRPWKHLKQAVNHLGNDPPDEALHEIRIRAKRMRYAAEAVSGVIGKPATRLAAAVADVQGVLGDMQDAVVAETWLRNQGSSPPSVALVAGQLIALERQKQAECRQAWVRPWKAASKRSLRKWLEG